MTAKEHGIRLIVGLGNPGPEYADTRHNAGAWFVETLCQQYQLPLKAEPKFNARLSRWSFGGKEYTILLPITYMNHSGQTVGAIAKYYQIAPESILVAHDELDIPAGEFRFKTGGGHAGHNGLRDIIHHLQSRDFHRIRIGIGHPGHKDEVTDYVLSKPSKEDKHKIRETIQNAISALQKFVIATTSKVEFKDGV